MKLKQLLTLNLEDTKAGKVIFILIIVITAVLFITSQFSIENKCKRKVDSLLNLLPNDFKGDSIAVDSVRKSEIEKCINESK